MSNGIPSSGLSAIGIIGAGNIGSTVARLAIDAGYDVIIANSRGPETLSDLVADLGERARAGTADEAAAAGDIVVATVPLHAYEQIPAGPLAGKTVLDTINYYPERDGQVASLDDHTATTSGLLQAHLPDAYVVKAFNNIFFKALAELGAYEGFTGERTALPIFGDDAGAKATATAVLADLGYDVVDGGGLDESWRSENGQPVYVYPYAEGDDPNQVSPGSADVVAARLTDATRDGGDPRDASSKR